MIILSIDTFLRNLELFSEDVISVLKIIITFVIAGFFGWLAYVIAKKWLGKLIMKIAHKTPFKWDDLLFDSTFFNRLALLIAPIVVRISLSTVTWDKIHILNKIVDVWIVFAIVAVILALMAGINRIYESFPISKNKPIKVFIQVIDIFFVCVAAIVVIGMLTGKDITTLLAGLAAFAAVLMLIFQNSILGLVAGIQLSANDMLRIGDWIEMPSSRADGDVLEINLTTVKVQNFDKTITTIPTYKLVSESFTNWRGMSDSDGRRIKRSVNIDVSTIRYLTDEDLENLKQSELLKEYIGNKQKEIKEYNAAHPGNLDGRKLTNVGTFREYLEVWLANNPKINQEMTHMVRQLQPTPTGLPLEIYCFSALKAWIDYENVQSDVFDHVFSVMDLFGLKAFQYSGGIPINQKA